MGGGVGWEVRGGHLFEMRLERRRPIFNEKVGAVALARVAEDHKRFFDELQRSDTTTATVGDQ